MPSTDTRELRTVTNPDSVVKRGFRRDVTLTFGASAVGVILAMFQGALIARALGPAGKGVVAIVLIAPPLVRLLLDGGLAAGNVYFLGRRQFDVSVLVGHAVSLALLSAAITGALVGVVWVTRSYATMFPSAPPGLLALAMVAVPLGVLLAHLQGVLQGVERFAAINFAAVAAGLAQLVLSALLLVGLDRGAGGVVLAALGSMVVSITICTVVLRRSGSRFRPRLERRVLGPLFGFGIRGHVGELLQYFNYRLDVLIVNLYLGPVAVGLYSVSTRLAELLWYLPDAVGFILFPRAARESDDTLKRFTPAVVLRTLGLTTAFAVVLALVGPTFIRVVYSSAFEDAYRPLLLLLPGAVLLGGGKVLSHDLAGRGHPQLNSIVAGVSLVATVLLDLILIPRWGISGAAAASSVSYALTFVLLVALSRRLGRREESSAVLDDLSAPQSLALEPDGSPDTG